jgi:hypothetical protein
MARFEQVQFQEAAMDGLNPVCLSTVLTHGKKTERAIVPMRGNGLAHPDTEALKVVTAEQLRDYCTGMVNLARGLGERITYLGLSVGGTRQPGWPAPQ